ncbi:MAG: hypothetical protein RLZZ399_2365 [Verrucomicrobiota bacterium]|jgi:tetratricopeptide (TPR) repeat protein
MRPQVAFILGLAALASLGGCERYSEGRYHSGLMEAQKRLAAADTEGAIRAYEMLLDGTPRTAEAHYRLGQMYADHLKEPMGALHHFSRYLAIAPDGPFAKEAKSFRKEGELLLMSQLGKGAPMTQEEAARMKNENLALRKTLAELRAVKTPPPVAAVATPGAAKGEVAQKPIPPGARTHKVAPGDTLGSIALKYYKNKGRWKDIQDANFYTSDGGLKLKPGQELRIP